LRLAPLYLAMRTADALAPMWPARATVAHDPWPPGISVVIPERDAPAMLGGALTALAAALAPVEEPVQVIVVVNGAPLERYAPLRAAYPDVEWVHDDAPLGFAGAVARGVARARHGATLLLNNDMTLAPDAIARLLALRAPGVFAIGAQILQEGMSGRREETGFTDWYVDRGGVRLYHAAPPASPSAAHLCASGGAAVFRTSLLRRYLAASRAYDPFYWEDVEWSLRAWRDGHSVLFCSGAQAHHRHRATTSRFYTPDELDRIVERNRILFDARHGVSDFGADWLMERICDLPYRSQSELAALRHAAGVLRHRVARRRSPQPTRPPSTAVAGEGAVTVGSSYSFRLRASDDRAPQRPRVLFVTPFAVFPPRHGGARRVAELVRGLVPDCGVALVSDEASLYDARSFADFAGLALVRLTGRDDAQLPDEAREIAARMRQHCHPALQAAVDAAIADFTPDIVQIEYAELAPLVRRRRSGACWVLSLHDAYGPADFGEERDAAAFASDVAAFDAVTVCSAEDAALVTHPRCVLVPNGARLAFADYRPSNAQRILFVGPFRYQPNRDGIAAFLRLAWPAIRAAVPAATLTILGGDEHVKWTRDVAEFAAPGVEVMAHRDDVARLLAQSALTINPLVGIRGSAVKLVESLAAGRMCVSTVDGARGMADPLPALVVVPDIAAMAAPVIELLRDPDLRRRREAPDRAALAPFGWPQSIARLRSLYDALRGAAHAQLLP
jgi:GT2 family glycosyltransferase/glycosyltransferase involved in cell wall biosynthesis